MKKIALLSAVLVLMTAASAQANVAISVSIGDLVDQNGQVPSGPSKVLCVIDRNHDGLGTLANASPTSWPLGADDWIVQGTYNNAANTTWFQTTGMGGNSNAYVETLYNYIFPLGAGGQNSLDTGDPIYVLWFPGLSANATAPGQNQPFGVINLSTLDSMQGVLPVEQGTASFFDDGQSLTASYVTTPEPATMLLLAAGGALTLIRRRRTA
jgi:hypothetical protein